MAKQQSAISFKLPLELKQQIDAIVQRHDTTLTGLVLGYFERRVQAEKEAEARGSQPSAEYEEVSLLLEDELARPLRDDARRLGITVGEFVHRLCESARPGGEPTRAPVPVFRPHDYAEFPQLVECVRKAYLDDRSPIDALLKVAATLPPAPVPLAQLFTAALQAVPVDQVISERVELGLRMWREQSRTEA
jgi:hypothetical protein